MSSQVAPQIPNADHKMSLEKFQKSLNKEPQPNEVLTNKFSGGMKYLPISFVEMTLDELFFGLWQTTGFETRIIGNEIAGKVELSVFHPVANIWITRTGAAASLIRQQAGAKPTDVDSKIKNALEMDYPHLLADCLKSAAKSLGKAFGRDLNRQFADTYKAIVTEYMMKTGQTDLQIGEQLPTLQNVDPSRTYHLNRISRLLETVVLTDRESEAISLEMRDADVQGLVKISDKLTAREKEQRPLVTRDPREQFKSFKQ